MLTEDLVLEILELVRGRFYGKYKGSVTEVEDSGRGRIKAKVPAVFQDTPTGWCDPCVPYAGDGVGFAFLPEVGTGVWIEFEGGDPSRPIWSGCYWREDEFPDDAGPKKKVIATKSGHKIVFDDDEETIEVTDPNENTVTFDSDGITLKRGSGKLVVSDQETNINDGAMQVSANLMADFLTTASTMMCPHGGTISASTSNTKVQADGAYVLRPSDTFSVSGCSFSTSAGPAPCSQVVWVTESLKNTVSEKVLTKDSEGMCIGPTGTQGTVQISQTQAKGSGD